MAILPALTLGASVGSSLISGHSARRDIRRQRDEIRRRELQLEATGESTAAAIEAAGRGAAAPLRREADLLEDAREFRSPLIEQALTESVREQAGPARARSSVARNPAAARAGVVDLLFQSRALLAREHARVERATRLRTARADLLRTAGQIETTAAGDAARARMSSAQAIAGLPTPPSAPNTFAALSGGIISSLDALGDEDRAAIEEYLGGLFGGGGPEDVVSGPSTVTAMTESQFNATGRSGGIPDDLALVPDDFLERLRAALASKFTI